MFVTSFIINTIKRHPRCLKLIQRKGKDGGNKIEISNDPYLEDETDPMESKAMKSSLWEIEIIMKHHYDSRVRNYTKVFKTDFMRKAAFFKCEEFTQVDSLDILLQDLNDIDDIKEGEALKRNLLVKYS